MKSTRSTALQIASTEVVARGIVGRGGEKVNAKAGGIGMVGLGGVDSHEK